jgi:hypothetical protein
MKKALILLVITCSLLFISCGGEAVFAGRAHRLKAEKGLKEIRNALEKYVIKNGQYPEESEWEAILEPYFRREIHPDPDWISRKKMSVMRAKTMITQCEGIIKEIKKNLFTADSTLQSRISEYLNPIDSALTYASYEIKEARQYEYRNVGPELNELLDFLSRIDIGEEKEKVMSLMRQEKEELGYIISDVQNSLLERDSLKGDDLINEDAVVSLFGHIERKLGDPLLIIQGESLESRDEADTISLYHKKIKDQVDNIINSLDSKKDEVLIKNLNELDNKMISYIHGDKKLKFLDDIAVFKKKIPVAVNLFNSFYADRMQVLDDNKVLNGFSSLGNLVSMVKLYEDENDSLPTGNLYELFKEEEAMKEIAKDLSSDPYLEVEDNGYKLFSEANDSERTKLVMHVRFANNYRDLVKESFEEGPFYETDDTGQTYFIWVKAKDVENTILTESPKQKGSRG